MSIGFFIVGFVIFFVYVFILTYVVSSEHRKQKSNKSELDLKKKPD
jgi:phosphotransferase system  glucose/maltose/N-acetylglucosamine-specific IIC component